MVFCKVSFSRLMIQDGLSSSTLLWILSKMQPMFSTAASPASALLRLDLPSKRFLVGDAQPLPLYSHTTYPLEFLTWVWRNLSDLLVKYLDGRFQPL